MALFCPLLPLKSKLFPNFILDNASVVLIKILESIAKDRANRSLWVD